MIKPALGTATVAQRMHQATVPMEEVTREGACLSSLMSLILECRAHSSILIHFRGVMYTGLVCRIHLYARRCARARGTGCSAWCSSFPCPVSVHCQKSPEFMTLLPNSAGLIIRLFIFFYNSLTKDILHCQTPEVYNSYLKIHSLLPKQGSHLHTRCLHLKQRRRLPW